MSMLCFTCILCSTSGSSFKGAGRHIWLPNLLFSSKILLSESAGSNVQKMMRASQACLNVKLCSALLLAAGGGSSGGYKLFSGRRPKRPLRPNYPSDLNQIWYEASGHRGLVILCCTSASAPNPALSLFIAFIIIIIITWHNLWEPSCQKVRGRMH